MATQGGVNYSSEFSPSVQVVPAEPNSRKSSHVHHLPAHRAIFSIPTQPGGMTPRGLMNEAKSAGSRPGDQVLEETVAVTGRWNRDLAIVDAAFHSPQTSLSRFEEEVSNDFYLEIPADAEWPGALEHHEREGGWAFELDAARPRSLGPATNLLKTRRRKAAQPQYSRLRLIQHFIVHKRPVS